MLGTSTLVRPQQVLIQILIDPDVNGYSVTPAYFSPEVTKFMLNRKLIALESYANIDMPLSPLSPMVPVLSGGAVFTSASLTLLREPGNGVPGGDFYKNLPLYVMRRCTNRSAAFNSAPELWRCDPTEISWNDSFVNLPTPIRIGDRISVPFLATFLLPEQDPEPYRLVHVKR